ncbi:MAG: NCS2 family permease [Deltaproteobacteria bacterium]|nr:NCS2 family permease [Deltaproteobacteria bacterium]
MCYIIFVQPAILQSCGMSGSAVMAATCISSAAATLVMAFSANYPVALAPAMGHNAFFAFTVCGVLGYTWQQALAANFISGAVFLGLTFFGFRKKLLNAVPSCLKHGIAVGIGLLIAVIGFEWAGIIVGSPATYITRGDLGNPAVLVAISGFLVIVVLTAFKVPGALLVGLLVSTMVALAIGLVNYQGVVQLPPSLRETAFQLDFKGLFSSGFGSLLAVVFVFFFLDLFDTIGTLIGVSGQAGLLDDEGNLPRAGGALFADAVGTVVGTLLGTSTVTSYVESSAGVAAGARTGLANIATAFLFIISLFFYPLVAMVAGEYQISPGVFVHPVIAPVLILVGMFMMKGIEKVKWKEFEEALPAFLAISVMPLTFSITEGISAGFVSYSLLKLLRGRLRDSSMWVHAFSVLFLLRYVLLATGLIKG